MSPSAADLTDRLIRQLEQLQAASQELNPDLCSTEAKDRVIAAIDTTQADLSALRARIGSA